jgi:hypothetical protein
LDGARSEKGVRGQDGPNRRDPGTPVTSVAARTAAPLRACVAILCERIRGQTPCRPRYVRILLTRNNLTARLNIFDSFSGPPLRWATGRTSELTSTKPRGSSMPMCQEIDAGACNVAGQDQRHGGVHSDGAPGDRESPRSGHGVTFSLHLSGWRRQHVISHIAVLVSGL